METKELVKMTCRNCDESVYIKLEFYNKIRARKYIEYSACLVCGGGAVYDVYLPDGSKEVY